MQRAAATPGMRPVSLIRIRGIVQGVGFRPTVWRVATDIGAEGDVSNDGDGVLVRLADPEVTRTFIEKLRETIPPLARIDSIEHFEELSEEAFSGFTIVESRHGRITTGVSPDAATCPACLADIRDPSNRRYRYPFTNCTHCGPRLSIIRGIPYDREQTSMAAFTMCPSCQAEYDSPGDRRFHAQPNACPVCGPRIWLERLDGQSLDTEDAIEEAAKLLRQGKILAIKGIGGFHLAVDATNAEAVQSLRRRKRRFAKPFALMAHDLRIIEKYCLMQEAERELLESPAAPVVLLECKAQANPLPDGIAPGQKLLGFMLPYSPLHHLLLEHFETPLVMTSGNLSEEPQCTQNRDAVNRLGTIADSFLLHDREIVNRVDDSVARVINGRTRLLRRARGYAPASLPLPKGFDEAAPILALGGELKNSFCLVRNGEAILSQHMGDLEDFSTWRDTLKNLDLYRELYAHEPQQIAIDAHPDYISGKHGRKLAEEANLHLHEIQHHHAHIAACLAENGHGLHDGPVAGIALDGLGFGPDKTIWGGEFLVVDYRTARRAGHIRQVAMPGGTRAILEPWRNTYAWLRTLGNRNTMSETHDGLDLFEFLQLKPLASLDTMIDKGLNSPLTSSCGRLFDAVAAATGICRERIDYEGQAAIAFESLIDEQVLTNVSGYSFMLETEQGILLNPAPMWSELLEDLQVGQDTGIVAARFHKGLASAVCEVAEAIARDHGIATIALSGGVFQNATLLSLVERQLNRDGYRVLSHETIPANDGGLALGQAVIAAARSINEVNH